MARTPLFRALNRALAEAGAPFGPRALSRRSVLALGAAAAASACLPRTGAEAEGDVAIVGAGAAGLTIAYRLAEAGRAVTLYEASDRLGGRMFTRRDFNDGQFCELGGEFVDSNHAALRDLAGELGVAITRLSPEGQEGEDLYHIDTRFYRQSDMLNAQGRGAFARLAARIAEDQAALLDADEDWTERARTLDQMSLELYLTNLANYAPAWATRLLSMAYHGEFGIAPAQQSALNLVDFIGAESDAGFQMFGESDEAWRIEGGSSALTDALAARLGAARVARQHALAAIARTDAGVRLTFDGPDGRVERDHARVVLALPFTKLRTVEGLGALGLSAEKLRAIRELGYGDNAKLMAATRDRAWARGEHALQNALYSTRAQIVWETSRAQPGARGVLTNFLAGQRDRNAALENLRAGLREISREAAASLDTETSAWMDWTRQPFALGSYAGALVGQYTTLMEETATPSEDGRIQFAGEHTSVDFIGFMNGAVESGERVAEALLSA